MNEFMNHMNEIESITVYQKIAVFKLEVLIHYLDENNLHSNENTARLLDEIFSSLNCSVQDLTSASSDLCTYYRENKESEVKNDRPESKRIS